MWSFAQIANLKQMIERISWEQKLLRYLIYNHILIWQTGKGCNEQNNDKTEGLLENHETHIPSIKDPNTTVHNTSTIIQQLENNEINERTKWQRS